MIPIIKIRYHVYDIRIRNQISLRELSRLSGVSKSQINNIENGLKHPTVYTLCLLSQALGVSPHDLFSFEVEHRPP